jgi:hypothetical protein
MVPGVAIKQLTIRQRIFVTNRVIYDYGMIAIG